MKAKEKTTGGIIYGAVEYQSNSAEWRVKGRNIAGGFVDCPASDVVMLPSEQDILYGDSIPVAIQPCYAQTETGLSRREFFAAIAMEGILASDIEHQSGAPETAQVAVEYADALIVELNKKEDEK